MHIFRPQVCASLNAVDIHRRFIVSVFVDLATLSIAWSFAFLWRPAVFFLTVKLTVWISFHYELVNVSLDLYVPAHLHASPWPLELVPFTDTETSYIYVCITTNQQNTKSNPSPTTKRHTVLCIQLNICPAFQNMLVSYAVMLLHNFHYFLLSLTCLRTNWVKNWLLLSICSVWCVTMLHNLNCNVVC